MVNRPKGKTLTVNGQKVQVEIMDTEAKKEKGLSDRQSLCADCGLLFVYDTPGVYAFWMRRMHFDIDIIWILGDKVVDITFGAKKPPAEEFEAPKTFYRPLVAVDKVLEVNAGWAREKRIKVGEVVKY